MALISIYDLGFGINVRFLKSEFNKLTKLLRRAFKPQIASQEIKITMTESGDYVLRLCSYVPEKKLKAEIEKIIN